MWDIIAAKYENQVHTLRLSPVDNLSDLEAYLELMNEDLGCCPQLVTNVALRGVCSKCTGNNDAEPVSVKQEKPEQTPKRKGSSI